ncbi:hypothetical protein T440DRAFT_481354 [Plenodomus tracheiphilus IPT5]|uniref:Uncharacterized protein n=1 Tax=Plenodomus tracheiphilus IPT5 TaxID=1408161 RepID=A0A6A7B053_9PLEO|nr:hypothetical protein T440DRAFT_481354 [Plenodomus tracheiphilus IPT5]
MLSKLFLVAAIISVGLSNPLHSTPSQDNIPSLTNRDIKCSHGGAGYGHLDEIDSCIQDLFVNNRTYHPYISRSECKMIANVLDATTSSAVPIGLVRRTVSRGALIASVLTGRMAMGIGSAIILLELVRVVGLGMGSRGSRIR